MEDPKACGMEAPGVGGSMRIEMGSLEAVKRTCGSHLTFGITQKYTLIREDGYKKEFSAAAHKEYTSFEGPTYTDYAEALELIAKQLRELKL